MKSEQTYRQESGNQIERVALRLPRLLPSGTNFQHESHSVTVSTTLLLVDCDPRQPISPNRACAVQETADNE